MDDSGGAVITQTLVAARKSDSALSRHAHHTVHHTVCICDQNREDTRVDDILLLSGWKYSEIRFLPAETSMSRQDMHSSKSVFGLQPWCSTLSEVTHSGAGQERMVMNVPLFSEPASKSRGVK